MPSGMSPLRARAMKVALLLQRSAGWGRCAGWMIPDSQSMLDRQVSQSGNEAQRSEMRTMCRRSTRAADGRLARQMSHEDEELGYSMPLKLGEGFASARGMRRARARRPRNTWFDTPASSKEGSNNRGATGTGTRTMSGSGAARLGEGDGRGRRVVRDGGGGGWRTVERKSEKWVRVREGRGVWQWWWGCVVR